MGSIALPEAVVSGGHDWDDDAAAADDAGNDGKGNNIGLGADAAKGLAIGRAIGLAIGRAIGLAIGRAIGNPDDDDDDDGRVAVNSCVAVVSYSTQRSFKNELFQIVHFAHEVAYSR